MRRWLVVGSLVLAAIGFAVAVALATAAGCDTSPLYPDMIGGDLSGPPIGDLGAGMDAPAPPPPDAALPGRTLVWSDEFDGAAGAPPDASKWSFDVGGSGWGNQELEYDTARPENVALDGAGHLAITARSEAYMGKSYTSGRINTLGTFTHAFGRFEARMQLPAGQGMWPAFWLLGNNQPHGGLAGLRRDRHHREPRAGAQHGARHRARPRLLGRRRHHRDAHRGGRAAVGRLPRLRHRVDRQSDRVFRRRQRPTSP